MEKGVLKYFAKLTGKYLPVAGLGRADSLKNRLWDTCFSGNFGKLLKANFLQNASGRLLLEFTQNVLTVYMLSKTFLPSIYSDDEDELLLRNG